MQARAHSEQGKQDLVTDSQSAQSYRLEAAS